MRCTKCHYLSFEPEPRCRNCGHDLSIDELSLDAPAGNHVPSGAAANNEDPLADFFLDRNAHGSSLRAGIAGDRDGGVALMAPPAAAHESTAVQTSELPLFVRDIIEDEEDLTPLVKVPPRPRQPLAVRRGTPDPSKLRMKYAPAHEPDLLDVADEQTSRPAAPAASRPLHVAAPSPAPAPVSAGVGRRLVAAAIDAGVLAAIAATTVGFTLRVVELPLASVLALPAIPMVAFFALVSLGYELMFTAANGQTIGKMAMGLRVVSDEGHDPAEPVTLKQAALRALSMLPLGAGLVSALAGQGLAMHDRVAHTRVVRA